MNISADEAYHLVSAIYFGRQTESESGVPSDLTDFLTEENLSSVWDLLSKSRQNELEKFVTKNESLFNAFPENHQNDDDMEMREEAINVIQEQLQTSISFVE